MLMVPATARLLVQHQQYVTFANNKATVLYRLIELAPDIIPNTHIVLTTDLSRSQLEELGLFDFIRRDMFNSALYVLYEERRPQFAYFCLADHVCSNSPEEETLFRTADVAALLKRTLIFTFDADLSVALVHDPTDVFNFDVAVESYQPSARIISSANLPPRARTMLVGRQ